MSILGDLLSGAANLAKDVGSFLGGSSIGSNLAKAALTAYALRQSSKSLAQENQALERQQVNAYRGTVDQGVRIQVNPDTTAKIPVCYGRATLGGRIVDARISANNRVMHYCLAITERTGTLLSTAAASTYVFNDVFANDERLIFQSDGITVDYSIDRDGNRDYSLQGNMRVYLYAGNSDLPQVPEYYTNGGLLPAYLIMPTWTPAHDMSDLVFAIVQVDYARETGVTNLPNMSFSITNSMQKPGDVIYDYMTNSRYGCGIDPSEISSS